MEQGYLGQVYIVLKEQKSTIILEHEGKGDEQ